MRHFKDCEGFGQLRNDNPGIDFLPLGISWEEFLAFKEFRKAVKPGENFTAPPLVQAVTARFLEMVEGAMRNSGPASHGPPATDVIVDAAIAAELPEHTQEERHSPANDIEDTILSWIHEVNSGPLPSFPLEVQLPHPTSAAMPTSPDFFGLANFGDLESFITQQ